jgi:hypothetical protein
MKCPCGECSCGDNCTCKPGQPGCDACAAFQKQKAAEVAAVAPQLQLASVQALKKALAERAAVVDLRRDNEAPASVGGSVRLVWDGDAGTMPLDGLPADKAAPIIVH